MSDLSMPARAGNTTPPTTSEARDLRNLLEAVAEALTVPYGDANYQRRLEERAGWALATIRGALDEDPADIGWNADFLRGKLAAEQADDEARAAKSGERQ